MLRFQTVAEVWAAIDAGVTVHWATPAYALTVEECDPRWYSDRERPLPVGYRNGKCLRVTCTGNYFGSWLGASELPALYAIQS